MSGTVRFTSTDDPAVWDDLVARHPGATGFHDWDWLTLQADVFGWRFDPLVVLHDDDPVGVFPLLSTTGRTRRPAMPPFPYVGPLVPAAVLGETLHAFRRWQVRHGVLAAHVDLGPGITDVAASTLAAAGVEATPDRTYVVDLADTTPELLLAGMKRGARQAVTTASRKGVVVRPSLPGELTTHLPMVLEESYSSRGVPSPYPTDIGARLERWAQGRDDVRFLSATVADEVAGVIVALTRHPVVTGWAGGTLRAFRTNNPSTAIFHELLRSSLEQGHTAVDLVGHVDEGISRFKTSLGATERPFWNLVVSPLPPQVRSAALAVRGRLRTPV